MPLKFDNWFQKYIKSLFILSQTFKSTFKNPDKDGFQATDELLIISMKCYIQCLANIIPDLYFHEKFVSFIYMTDDIKEYLYSNQTIINFLNAFGDIKQMLDNNKSYQQDTSFLDYCLKEEDNLFKWVYLLQSYIFILRNKSGNFIRIPSFNETKEMYSIDHVSKDDWGNVLWYILHTSPLYSVIDPDEFFYNYKAMLSCLQYLLPCPKCRAHLRENLSGLDIDYCKVEKKTCKNKIFEFSWRLHNIVNASLNKYQPSLKEALQMYA